MNLSDWFIHIESFHHSEIELGLQRIKQVADKLHLLDFKIPCILVGGTNGKGSCVAMLESIALEQDKKVACYTSPHLLQFNERIRLNGQNVVDDDLVAAFEKIEAIRGNIPLTFFEFTTLAALIIFKKAKLDLIVFEVGLGGRQDATNIVEPSVSVITTIDKDHTDWLGDTVEAIAYEKAGILRKGKKAFIGDTKTFDLLNNVVPELAEEMSLVQMTSVELSNNIKNNQINPYGLLEQNIMLAISAFEQCFKHQLDQIAIEQALINVSINGRFQQLDITPLTIVDVAHNVQAANNLKQQIDNYIKLNSITKITAICGMMADKATEEILSIFLGQINHWCFVDLEIDRAIKSNALQQIYFDLQLHSKSTLTQLSSSSCFTSVGQAFKWIERNHQENELILVFGSFITVANMLQCAHSSIDSTKSA